MLEGEAESMTIRAGPILGTRQGFLNVVVRSSRSLAVGGRALDRVLTAIGVGDNQPHFRSQPRIEIRVRPMHVFETEHGGRSARQLRRHPLGPSGQWSRASLHDGREALPRFLVVRDHWCSVASKG